MSLAERLVAAANGDVRWRKALLLEAASRIEAQRGETRSGSISEADESLTAESGDAQTPKSVTKGA